jgi:hypothetical protein
MNSNLTALVVVATLTTIPCTVAADGMSVLSPAQMDAVTAGLTARSSVFSFSFEREGFLLFTRIDEERVLETPTGSITSSIFLNSVGFRGFRSSIDRAGTFQTTVSFD